MLRKLLREPLVHFLAAGALIYLVFALWGSAADGTASRRIVVNRAALLQYLQYQAKAFEPGTFSAQFDAMSAKDRQQLIDDFVREEVLYREANALGLSQGDYVMRRRLVQKMLFLLEQNTDTASTDAELQAYLDAHATQYQVAAAWTFTHVFIDPANHGGERADAEARRLLQVLNSKKVPFSEAPHHSDRFPFLQNYVERTGDYIASQFGPAFLADFTQLPVDAGKWQGPLRSDLGWHLVLLTNHTAERTPALSEIREQVQDDLRRDRAAEATERTIRALIDTYKVELDMRGGKP